jgi:hypothetical protein
MKKQRDRTSPFQRDRLVACLMAQARICDRIAAESWNEETALKFRKFANDCEVAAASEKDRAAKPTTQAVWPVPRLLVRRR